MPKPLRYRETRGENMPYTTVGSYVTRFLHNAGISNVESALCAQKERKIVDFKLYRKHYQMAFEKIVIKQ